MADVMRKKYIVNEKQVLNTRFRKFKHVSALMVHIFHILAPYVKKIVNKKSEMEIT